MSVPSITNNKCRIPVGVLILLIWASWKQCTISCNVQQLISWFWIFSAAFHTMLCPFECFVKHAQLNIFSHSSTLQNSQNLPYTAHSPSLYANFVGLKISTAYKFSTSTSAAFNLYYTFKQNDHIVESIQKALTILRLYRREHRKSF